MDIGMRRCLCWQTFSIKHNYEVNKNSHYIIFWNSFITRFLSIYRKTTYNIYIADSPFCSFIHPLQHVLHTSTFTLHHVKEQLV